MGDAENPATLAFATYNCEVLAPEIAPGTQGPWTTTPRIGTRTLQTPWRPRLLVPLPATVGDRSEPHQTGMLKAESHLRKVGARTFTEVFAAIGSICDLYHPAEC